MLFVALGLAASACGSPEATMQVDAGRPAQDGDSGSNGSDDVVCGNGDCEPGENAASCPEDCQRIECGDGVCNGGETNTSCPQDCHTCGDGLCNGGETSTSCPNDCHACGDGVCNGGESVSTCPGDCSGSLDITNDSSAVIDQFYVAPCGGNWSGNILYPYTIAAYGGHTVITGFTPGCWNVEADTTHGWGWDAYSVQFTAGTTLYWDIQ